MKIIHLYSIRIFYKYTRRATKCRCDESNNKKKILLFVHLVRVGQTENFSARTHIQGMSGKSEVMIKN